MNAHLAMLLTTIYGAALAPAHREDLQKSTLTDETIRQQRIRSVPPVMIGKLLGFDIPAMTSALLFPFLDPAGGYMDHVRVKVFPTLNDAEGHSVKYLQRRGSVPHLYFVARCLEAVCNGSDELVLVEGEKKALAVAQLGLAAVGFCGVEGWHTAGSSALLADFEAIHLRGRPVSILPDGDFNVNVHVADAVRRFAAALRARGAQAAVRLLPAAA